MLQVKAMRTMNSERIFVMKFDLLVPILFLVILICTEKMIDPLYYVVLYALYTCIWTYFTQNKILKSIETLLTNTLQHLHNILKDWHTSLSCYTRKRKILVTTFNICILKVKCDEWDRLAYSCYSKALESLYQPKGTP